MCFSPAASFAASGVLAVMGVYSLNKTKGRYKLIGAIPLLFATQQLIEGIQWISEPMGAISQLMAYLYVLFAFMIWPIYIPFAIFMIDKKRRHIIRWFLLLGIGTAAFLSASLVAKPLSVLIAGNIKYPIDIFLDWPVLAGYFIAVCGTPIVSSKPGFKLLGVIALVSAIAVRILFNESFVSVWCFFAAIISGTIFMYARSDKAGDKLKSFNKAA